jgi:hypothetical protein
MMRAHLGWIAIMLVLVLGGPALAQSAEPVAVLTEVKKGGSDGEIRVKLSGKDEWRAPQPLMSLTNGDEIRVKGSAARAVIVYTGGASTTVTASNSPFKVTRPTASGSTGRQVASIFGSMAQFLLGKEKEPVYTQLSTRSLKKDSDVQLVILSPRETRLLPEQVKFAWTGGPDSSKYAIRVFGPGVRWTQEDLANKPVVYPATAPKLQAGVRYLWEVRTAEALPERAQFELVSDQEWQRIKQQLAEIKPVAGSPTTATLARVTVLFQERLYQSALEELTTAIAADKTEPNLQFMLGHVYDRMGLREQAAAAFDHAQKLSTD